MYPRKRESILEERINSTPEKMREGVAVKCSLQRKRETVNERERERAIAYELISILSTIVC